jgi:adenylate cyclase
LYDGGDVTDERDGSPRTHRPTLAQAFGATFVALALVLVGLLWLFYSGSRRTLLAAAEQLTTEVSRRVSDALEDHLADAERVIAAFEAKRAAGLVSIDDPQEAGAALLAELTGRERISALSLTRAQTDGIYAAGGDGHDPGDARLARRGRWQVSVARGARAPAVMTVTEDGDHWEARERIGQTTIVGEASDPTAHATFTSPSRPDQKGRTLWSDLSSAQGAEGSRVVTVQKALWSASGVVAVLRVSLLSDRIDELTRMPLEERGGRRPLVFLADEQGRLLARTSPGDQVRETDSGEVRVVPAAPSPALVAALATPALAALAPGGRALVKLWAGEPYLLNVTALPEGRTQDWRVGTLVPEAYFLTELQAAMRRVLLLAALLVLACLGGGALVLRATRRDLGGLIRETTRLRRFDFAPATAARPAFRDVMLAADSLEQAKTALRALGKYVPLDLVRQLYEARAEPMLGGRVQDVSMVFSDIEGFTSVSEALPLDVLAGALGRYLAAMTGAIHGARGIIDKYTGDGVMALWNAPLPCEQHPALACEGVLACLEATERLFASPAWDGLPPWRTRFGIHRDEVSVGHFGAPDRMSFTVMGDGVNLASRLEGLNKQYGTYILVSAGIEREARDRFVFRRLDRVAVKGKQQGVEVFELRGRRGQVGGGEVIPRYEAALDHYLGRRFDAALEHLGDPSGDPPSVVLAARCRRLQAEPPPPDWNGVYLAQEK